MNLKELTQEIINFRNDRDWKQFHNPKDLALSLTLEAAEVLEHFQWKNNDQVEDYIKTNKGEVADELADVLYWVILMSHDLDIDILQALNKKMAENKAKYPISKSKGVSTKYNRL
jgi:NTP pyrophosphatase (non-canonical NTP hydrolase)